jgi:hypothetical protein
MMHGDVEADDGAVAPAHDRRLLDSEMIHQGEHVGGHQVVTVGLFVAARAAVAAAVHDDDPVMLLQCANLMAPIIGIGEPAMNQQHGLAPAEAGVPDLDAVDRRKAALGSAREGRRSWKSQPLRRRMRRRSRRYQHDRGEKIS